MSSWQANLDTLEAILRWNDANDIRVFRVSSNTVPLASHPRASYPWREALCERFAELGDLMRGAGMRLSTHPGPYTRCPPPPTRRSRTRRSGSSTTTRSS